MVFEDLSPSRAPASTKNPPRCSKTKTNNAHQMVGFGETLRRSNVKINAQTQFMGTILFKDFPRLLNAMFCSSCHRLVVISMAIYGFLPPLLPSSLPIRRLRSLHTTRLYIYINISPFRRCPLLYQTDGQTDGLLMTTVVSPNMNKKPTIRWD